jgi:hypothetical protein
VQFAIQNHLRIDHENQLRHATILHRIFTKKQWGASCEKRNPNFPQKHAQIQKPNFDQELLGSFALLDFGFRVCNNA